LFDTPIVGSPVSFTVLPDKPDPSTTKLKPPPHDVLLTDKEHVCVVKTYDKFNNECISGGLNPQVRLQVIKQSVHDQTTLVPSNHTLSNPAEDQGNGEYFIRVMTTIKCTCKLVVNIDKNIPTAGGELPPLTLQIQNDPAKEQAKEAASSPGGNAPAARKKSAATQKLQQAASEVMMGFGAAEERRDKDALIVAAEAFADGAKSFDFDNAANDKGSPPKKDDKGAKITWSSSKDLLKDASPDKAVVADVQASGDAPCTPNKDLFDKSLSATDTFGSMSAATSSIRSTAPKKRQNPLGGKA